MGWPRLFSSYEQIDEQMCGESVKDDTMNDSTFPIEFIGGSRDGEVIDGTVAPEYCHVTVRDGIREIYERQE